METSYVETTVTYKYRAPGVPLDHPEEDIDITTERREVDLSTVATDPHPIGEHLSLQADAPHLFGEGSREYVVLLRFPLFERSGVLLGLDIIVTDPAV